MIQRTQQTGKKRSKRRTSPSQNTATRSAESAVAKLIETLRRPENHQTVGWARDVLRGIREVFKSELQLDSGAGTRSLTANDRPDRCWLSFRDRLMLIESELNIEDNSTLLRKGLRSSLLRTLWRMLKRKHDEERKASTGTRFAFERISSQPCVRSAESRSNGQSS